MARATQPSIVEAEARKKPAKVLRGIRIEGQLGGGHTVTHEYTSYEHEPKIYNFNESGIAKGGEHIAHHLAKHAGFDLPAASTGGDGAAEAEEE